VTMDVINETFNAGKTWFFCNELDSLPKDFRSLMNAFINATGFFDVDYLVMVLGAGTNHAVWFPFKDFVNYFWNYDVDLRHLGIRNLLTTKVVPIKKLLTYQKPTVEDWENIKSIIVGGKEEKKSDGTHPVFHPGIRNPLMSLFGK
jgi:hypothetical protein